ncbi:MAG: 2-amino-4-hydroxy-6-hydroxymethyldihydropteridine diphosphokinase [Candidatus Eiseniibacteriota bacterium]|nr:MAG: 2-amino-4-hydroxy-6-hydroxymethyldihydropteridine diphosphokinase [Candidatus Eisenbacteria bacterium]
MFLGIGSNLGERERNIRRAVDEIASLPFTKLITVSSLYDSEPVGDVEQANFVNAVALVETDLQPRRLLWNLMLIEKRMGRARTVKWGPRSIDLDVIIYGNSLVKEEGLDIPHPEMDKRAFVLIPLLEIDPDLVHPRSQEPLKKLLKKLKPHCSVKRKGRFWL